MLPAPRISRRIAYVSVFSVVYSLTRQFPVSAYVGLNSTLTLGEAFSPLAGMLFGPYVGASSVTLGTFLAFALGRPIVFDGLDFVPGAVAAAVAGFCFTGRKKESLATPLAFMAIYSIDPLSENLVSAGPFVIPFLWMHLLAVLSMAVVWLSATRLKLEHSSWLFIAATVFLSTMSAHVAGSVLYENVLVRINMVLSPPRIQSLWTTIFYLYPVERVLFTSVGTIIALPVIRTISRRAGGA